MSALLQTMKTGVSSWYSRMAMALCLFCNSVSSVKLPNDCCSCVPVLVSVIQAAKLIWLLYRFFIRYRSFTNL